MKFHIPLLAVVVLVSSLSMNSADAQIMVVADAIGDAIHFPDGPLGQDRSDLLLGEFNNNPRIAHVRFDLSAFSAQLTNPSLVLSSAEVILTENAPGDALNSNRTATFEAFLHTQDSGDWVVPDNGGTATLQPGVFGINWANRLTDPFNLDANAIDDPALTGANGLGRRRFASVGGLAGLSNSNNGPAFGAHDAPDVLFGTSQFNPGENAQVSEQPAGATEHTFIPGVTDETVTIDLLQNLTAAQLTGVLSDWVNGVNAGIGLFSAGDNMTNSQFSFESADAVNDGTGTGFALDTYTGGEFNTTVTTESGNGQGGTLLQLTFDLAGDINGDSQVDAADFTIIRQNFGSTTATFAQGDLNDDGTVDATDFRIWKDSADFLLANPPSGAAAVSVVPEPTSLVLCGLAVCTLGLKRRRVAKS